MKNMPRSLTLNEIRSFLGLAGFNKRFVDCFASIAYPLTSLSQNSKKFEWSEPCEKNIQLLKDRLNSAPMLTLLEGTKGFVVYFDKSRVGLGCVLMQQGKVKAYATR